MRVCQHRIVVPAEDSHAYSPDWRNQLACALHAVHEAAVAGTPVPAAAIDRDARIMATADPLLRTQIALFRVLGAAPSSYQELCNVDGRKCKTARALYPVEFAALQLYLQCDTLELSAARKLQAALLTRADMAVIAGDLGMTVPEVKAYAGLYWDCRANSGRPTWAVACENKAAMKLTRNSSLYERCLNVALYEGYEALREVLVLPENPEDTPKLRRGFDRRSRMVVLDRIRNDDGFTGDLVSALGHGLAERKLLADTDKDAGGDQQSLVSIVQQLLHAAVPTPSELSAPATDALTVASEADMAEQWARRVATYDAGVNSSRQVGDDMLKSSKTPAKEKPKAPRT